MFAHMTVVAIRAMNRTTEASSQSARHVRFQRNLAGNPRSLTQGGDGGHHRHRPTNVCFVESTDRLHQGFGDQTMMTKRTVVGSNRHLTSVLPEFNGQLIDIATCLPTEKDMQRWTPRLETGKVFNQKEQRGNADPPADQTAGQFRLKVKAFTQRTEQIDRITGL